MSGTTFYFSPVEPKHEKLSERDRDDIFSNAWAETARPERVLVLLEENLAEISFLEELTLKERHVLKTTMEKELPLVFVGYEKPSKAKIGILK